MPLASTMPVRLANRRRRATRGPRVPAATQQRAYPTFADTLWQCNCCSGRGGASGAVRASQRQRMSLVAVLLELRSRAASSSAISTLCKGKLRLAHVGCAPVERNPRLMRVLLRGPSRVPEVPRGSCTRPIPVQAPIDGGVARAVLVLRIFLRRVAFCILPPRLLELDDFGERVDSGGMHKNSRRCSLGKTP